MHITSFHTKINFKRNNPYEKPSHTNNPYKKPTHTNNPYEKPSHTNQHILTICMKNHYTNFMRINIFLFINQTNKHKAKIYNQCTHTLIIIKKKYFFSLSYIKNGRNNHRFGEKGPRKKSFTAMIIKKYLK